MRTGGFFPAPRAVITSSGIRIPVAVLSFCRIVVRNLTTGVSHPGPLRERGIQSIRGWRVTRAAAPAIISRVSPVDIEHAISLSDADAFDAWLSVHGTAEREVVVAIFNRRS